MRITDLLILKNKVEKGCEWVINGEGVATRKYDGTCCLIQDNKIYGRYDYKEGRTLPINAIPCQEKGRPYYWAFSTLGFM